MSNAKLPPGWENKTSSSKPNWETKTKPIPKSQNNPVLPKKTTEIKTTIVDNKAKNEQEKHKKNIPQKRNTNQKKDTKSVAYNSNNFTKENKNKPNKTIVILITLLILMFVVICIFAVLFFADKKTDNRLGSNETSSIFSETTSHNYVIDEEILSTEANTTESSAAESQMTEPTIAESQMIEPTTAESQTTEQITTEPLETSTSTIFNEYDFVGFWYPNHCGEDELTIHYMDSSTISFSLCYYGLWDSDIISANIDGNIAYFYDDEIEGILTFYTNYIGLYYTKTSVPYAYTELEYIFDDKREFSLHDGECKDVYEEDTTYYEEETTVYGEENNFYLNIVYDSSPNWSDYIGVWSSNKVMHTHGNTTCYDAVLYLELFDDNSIYYYLEMCNGNALYEVSRGKLYPDGDGTYSGSDYIDVYFIELGVYNRGIHMIITNSYNIWDYADALFDLKIE